MHIFLFFRDFRLTDNLGLIQALKKYKTVVPIFVFTPEQIQPEHNPYFSNHSVQFMCESLKDLAKQIQQYQGNLYIFYGDLVQILTAIHQKLDLHSLSFNIDYTSYARKRTDRLKSWCAKNKIANGAYEDYLLLPIGSLLKDNGTPYQIYSSFKNNLQKKAYTIAHPTTFTKFKFTKTQELKKLTYPIDKLSNLYKHNPKLYTKGGRYQAQRLITRLPKEYSMHRNTLNFTTSHLSPHIKYGTLSIREVLYAILQAEDEALYQQLIWREFYTYIAYYSPTVLQGAYFQKKYAKIIWEKNEKYLKAWQEGKTGYPIVDASMRELNTTGYMHNRGRLISANFFNRLLHLDWRLGERYFAQQLVDYDPAVNNGNWQWVTSMGVDPKPYFQRLFNPFLQSKKYDPDTVYIKKWLPQLALLPAKVLHDWPQHYHKYNLKALNYYAPIIEYKAARLRSLYCYKHLQ